jgi:S-DNA-T family DNA segregation ATPase FtsK/SpoIIIE
VDESEVESVVDFLRGFRQEDDYDEDFSKAVESYSQSETSEADSDRPGLDPLIAEAIEVVHEQGQASISMMQRRLRVGDARAARLVDEMEQLGIVGPGEGSKPRPILKTKMESLAMVGSGGGGRADEL